MLGFLKEKNELTNAFWATKDSFRGVAAFSAVINVLALVPSIYMLQVYDRVLASSNETTLIVITLLVIGLFVVAGMLESARTFVLVRAGAKMDMMVNKRVYDAAFAASLATGQSSAGQSLRDLTTVRQFVTGNGTLAFFDAPWFPIYLIVLYLLHPAIALLAAVGACISVVLTYLNTRNTKEPLEASNKLAIMSSGNADSTLRNAEVIHAMGMINNLKSRWFKTHTEFLTLQAQASDKAAVWTHAGKYFRIFLQSAALGLGALLVIEGEMSAGMMIAGSILVGKALQPIDLITGAYSSLANTKMSYERLKKLLETFPAKQEGMHLPEPKPRITFENVSATPPNSKTLTLRGINLDIPAGNVVGLIGPSGAGKSSMLRLITGVWRPAMGKVRLDGAELEQYDRTDIGHLLGYLPQDIELFAGSVAENIARFGELDSDRIVEAAKMAGVHELILNLPQGYDTNIGAAGMALSGGQRQRVALARAVYGDPKLLVLDEPNSNLDEAGEAALIQAIRKQKELGHTVIVATHKMNLLQVTDALVVMSNGTIQIGGPTQEVLAKLRGNNKPAPVASISTASAGE